MKAVINTSPLISLSILKKLDVLPMLFEEIYIPTSVFQEAVIVGKGKYGSADIEHSNWLKTAEITNTDLRDSIALSLDYGESEVITLAKELEINTVIIDEYAGRRYAKMLDINVVGTLGILLKAKEKGIVQQIKPLMELLLNYRRYIDRSLFEKVLYIAGET